MRIFDIGTIVGYVDYFFAGSFTGIYEIVDLLPQGRVRLWSACRTKVLTTTLANVQYIGKIVSDKS